MTNNIEENHTGPCREGCKCPMALLALDSELHAAPKEVTISKKYFDSLIICNLQSLTFTADLVDEVRVLKEQLAEEKDNHRVTDELFEASMLDIDALKEKLAIAVEALETTSLAIKALALIQKDES